jgi:hypothetical protein
LRTNQNIRSARSDEGGRESESQITAGLQILTVEGAMHGKGGEMPPKWGTFKQVRKADRPGATQRESGL